jgi:hypothetical protein
MIALLCFLLRLLALLFKSLARLGAGNASLRQQVLVLQRKLRGRVEFTNGDRLFFVQQHRWLPSVLKAAMIIRPETVVRWHRAGFRRYWRWKSRNVGRPATDRCRSAGTDPADEHREQALGRAAHPWRTAQARLCARPIDRRQTWPSQTVSRPVNAGAPSCATICRISRPWMCLWSRSALGLLYVLVIVRFAGRELMWINVTAQQVTEARGAELPDS